MGAGRCAASDLLLEGAMGASDFTELVCWQLADELNRFMWPIIQRPDVKLHRRFCEQVEDAASSAPRNIAEGFGRYDHKEFAQFVKIALSSEQETRTNLLESFNKGFITKEERDAGLVLTKRAIAATARFRRYLLSTPTPAPKPKPPKPMPVDR
jgi:four helix bundle protein